MSVQTKNPQSPLLHRFIIPTCVISFFLCLLFSASPARAAVEEPAVLDNGTVKLGVEPEANLGVPGNTPSSGEETTDVSLRLSSTGNDGVSPGGSQEG